jgi:acetyl esterase/lipase
MIFRSITAALLFFSFAAHAQSPNPLAAGHEEIGLWPTFAQDGATESVRIAETGDHVISHIKNPSITYFPADPKKATGAAIIIAPGGGHVELWIDHEGYRPAKWLSEQGIAAFVLKYRLGKEAGSPYTVDKESLGDIQRAIRLVRQHAAAWGIDTSRIGVMGFSAGGELAALAAMRFDSVQLHASDDIDRHSSRPDFQALIYPGNSSRFTVTKQSPPVFILCGADDGAAISEGMPKLYLKYKEAGVPAELHILAGVPHGFGIRDTNKGAVAVWPQRLYEWMQAMKIISL